MSKHKIFKYISISSLPLLAIGGTSFALVNTQNQNIISSNTNEILLNTDIKTISKEANKETSIDLPEIIDANDNTSIFYKIFAGNTGFTIDWKNNIYNEEKLKNNLLKYINTNKLFINPSDDKETPSQATLATFETNYVENKVLVTITFVAKDFTNQTINREKTQQTTLVLKEIPTALGKGNNTNIFNIIDIKLKDYIKAMKVAPKLSVIQDRIENIINNNPNFIPEVIRKNSERVKIKTLNNKIVSIDEANKTINFKRSAITIIDPQKEINFTCETPLTFHWDYKSVDTYEDQSEIIIIAALIPCSIVVIAFIIVGIYYIVKSYKERIWEE